MAKQSRSVHKKQMKTSGKCFCEGTLKPIRVKDAHVHIQQQHNPFFFSRYSLNHNPGLQ